MRLGLRLLRIAVEPAAMHRCYQQQLGLDGEVDERATLRADVLFAPQILDQIGAPLRQRSAERRSAINYSPTQTLNDVFEPYKPVL